MKQYTTSHLVKSEDLNHHDTLFAGRTAEWFVEAAFISAATAVGSPENVVCVNIHGLQFRYPIEKGEIATFNSRVAYVGKTSLIVYCKIYSEMTLHDSPVDGFLTFVCVDLAGNKIPHNLVLDETCDPEELEIRQKALMLLKK